MWERTIIIFLNKTKKITFLQIRIKISYDLAPAELKSAFSWDQHLLASPSPHCLHCSSILEKGCSLSNYSFTLSVSLTLILATFYLILHQKLQPTHSLFWNLGTNTFYNFVVKFYIGVGKGSWCNITTCNKFFWFTKLSMNGILLIKWMISFDCKLIMESIHLKGEIEYDGKGVKAQAMSLCLSEKVNSIQS